MDFATIASSSAGCAYLVSEQGSDAPLLVDCGIPVEKIKRATGHRLGETAACLVSHRHRDHSESMLKVAQAGVPVYASLETVEWARAYLGPHHRYRVLDPDTPQTVGPWTFSSFAVPHDAEGTVGFQVAGARGGRLLYLSDASYFPAGFARFKPTILAVECNHIEDKALAAAASGQAPMVRYRHTAGGHMSLERLVETLEGQDLASVKEIHLLHLSDEFSDEALMRRAVQEATGVPVYVAPKEAGR